MNRSSVRFRSLAPVFAIDYQAVMSDGKPLDFFMLQFCFAVACAQENLGTLSPFEAFLKHFLTKKWDGDHHKLHPDKSEPQEIRTLLSSTCQQQNGRPAWSARRSGKINRFSLLNQNSRRCRKMKMVLNFLFFVRPPPLPPAYVFLQVSAWLLLRQRRSRP